ncbi:MAG TPA: helix-turn-helix domain-containing protein [Sphingomicrobium sp.]|jgi:hypothetical protein
MTDINGTAEEDDRLVDTKEAARILDLSPTTLRKARVYGGAGSVPYQKLGRSVKYSTREIARYIAERTTRSTAQRWQIYAGSSRLGGGQKSVAGQSGKGGHR